MAVQGVQETPIVKGSELVATIYGIDFSFVHQSTKISDSGVTEVGGQGVRWMMARRRRNKTEKNLSLKELATKIAKAHNVTLEWQSSVNPQYEHVDQTDISDYALLVREASQAGLMVSEAGGKLLIKSRDQLTAPVYVLARGINLISYNISDVALSASTDDISALLTTENKSTIDPLESKVVNKADKDKVKDTSVTGKATPAVSGTLKQGVDTSTEKARTKRIAGLPSTFTVVMDERTVQIKPLDTLLTEGFGGVLDRIWLVDKVTHKASSNTTTFSVVSPIDVIDSAPATPTAANATAEAASASTPAIAGKGWMYPCNGKVTSKYGLRRHPVHGDMRLHNGWDIANSTGTPIYATRSGKVTFVGDRGKGGGNQINIDHGDGLTSTYLHNDSISAKEGQSVSQGEQIARMGSTGIGTGAHCHFTIRKGASEYIDGKTIFKKFAVGAVITAKEYA